MRMAFGLAGLLIGIGVLVWVMKEAILPYNQQVIEKGKSAREEAQQLAGVDSSGMRATDSMTMEAQKNGSRIGSMLVTSIIVGGPMEAYFGLRRNDSIIAVNGLDIDAVANGDDDLAKAYVFEAYQRQQTLLVIRNEQKVELPIIKGTPKPKSIPSTPNTGPPGGNAVQRQLEGIQQPPTH